MFADSAKNLQLLLNKLGEYAVNNKLSVNAKNSMIMIFGKYHYDHSDDFTSQDTVVARVNSYKFLGVKHLHRLQNGLYMTRRLPE